MQKPVLIPSDGLKLAGVLHLPDVEGPRPGVIVTHGFGGNKDGKTHLLEAELYESFGYVVLRLDFRGCGDSEGLRGNILCTDQVADLRNAVTWLSAQPEVDGAKILLSGQSFGAAVSIFTGAVDRRVAGVVSMGGWGDGFTKSQAQFPTEQAFSQFLARIAEGRKYRENNGEPLYVSRWEIVPIPEPLRKNLPAGSIMEFTTDTMESICAFRPKDVVSLMAPRPLLLMHAAHDSVTPTAQSIELFRHAGKGADLSLISDIDHFPFADGNLRVREILKGWLDRYFPAA